MSPRFRLLPSLVALLCVPFLACSESADEPDADPTPVDPGADAAPGVDAAPGSTPDAGSDASPGENPDAGADASPGENPDAGDAAVACSPDTCEGTCEGTVCISSTCVLGEDVATVQQAFDTPRCTTLQVPNGSWPVHDVNASRTLSIVGAGSGQSTFDAQSMGRILDVAEGVALHLEGLTLTRGRAASGGAVNVQEAGELSLEDVVFVDNVATSNGGAIHLNDATLQAERCTFVGNDVIFSGAAVTGLGGAIHARGSQLELADCTFEGNGVSSSAASGTLNAVRGGAIATNLGTELRVTGSDFRDNRVRTTGAGAADRQGGALYLEAGATTLEAVTFSANQSALPTNCTSCGNGSGGAIHADGGSLTITEGSFAGNQVLGVVGQGLLRGGALFVSNLQLDVEQSTFEANQVRNGSNRSGGAAFVISPIGSMGMTALLRDTVFRGNLSRCDDPACAANTTGKGGGMQIQVTSSELSVRLDRVLAVGNESVTPSTFNRGGFLGTSVLNAQSTLRLRVVNSTWSDNFANGGASAFELSGGGVFDVRFANSTLTANRGPSSVGLAITGAAPLVRMENSILYEPLGATCTAFTGLGLVSGGGLVHAGVAACNVTPAGRDLITTTPGLLPLADNGGASETHALAANSPVLGAGELGGCSFGDEDITVDQRNSMRTTANCTPGAFSP